jgi:glycosyltransferase involved in cell wall biosynthesis
MMTEQAIWLTKPVPITDQNWPEGTVPVVSISCIAYNQEKFIRECIDGFLIQETCFPVEILINDDASTDKTAEIIREYQEKYPFLIKPIYQTENQYTKKRIDPNVAFNFPRATGKYIALCEGDDFWTDPLKLQKQITLLESRPDVAICFHKVEILKDDHLVDDYITKVPAEETTLCDLAEKNYIHTPSCVFRNRGLEIVGPHFKNSPIGDYYYHCMNAQYGKIYHISEVMGVYRNHDNSMWLNKSDLHRFENMQKVREAIIKDMSDVHIDAKYAMIKRHIYFAFLLHREYGAPLASSLVQNCPYYLIQIALLLGESHDELNTIKRKPLLFAFNKISHNIKNRVRSLILK